MSKTCIFMLNTGYFKRRHQQENISLYKNNVWNVDLLINKANKLMEDPNILCGLPTSNGASFCSVHKCNVVDCNEPAKMCGNFIHGYSISSYCKKHNCQYEYFNYGIVCYNLCHNSDFCEFHKCAICSQHIAYNNNKYCIDHICGKKCKVYNCDVLVNTNKESIQSYYCINHSCVKCKKNKRNDLSQFCYLCQCSIKDCVNMRENIRFCKEHMEMICSYELSHCEELKTDKSDYCKYHKCDLVDCLNHIYEYDDDDGGYHSKYCFHHDKINDLCKLYGFSLDDKRFVIIYNQNNSNDKQFDDQPISDKEQLLKQIMVEFCQYAKQIC